MAEIRTLDTLDCDGAGCPNLATVTVIDRTGARHGIWCGPHAAERLTPLVQAECDHAWSDALITVDGETCPICHYLRPHTWTIAEGDPEATAWCPQCNSTLGDLDPTL